MPNIPLDKSTMIFWMIALSVLGVIGFVVWLMQRRRQPYYHPLEADEDPLEIGYEPYKTQAILVGGQKRRRGCMTYLVICGVAMIVLGIARSVPDYFEYQRAKTYTPTPTITATPTVTPDGPWATATMQATPTITLVTIPLQPLETGIP